VYWVGVPKALRARRVNRRAHLIHLHADGVDAHHHPHLKLGGGVVARAVQGGGDRPEIDEPTQGEHGEVGVVAHDGIRQLPPQRPHARQPVVESPGMRSLVRAAAGKCGRRA
jgi:hypothetical protein